MNISQEGFSLSVQDLQHFEGVSVSPVHANPLEANADFPGMPHNLECQLNFGSMCLLCLRNTRLIAAPRILRPLLGQIQPRINQADSIPAAEGAKDTNLAVLLLPQPAIPLARDAYRFVALLLKRTFIDVQPGVLLATHAGIRISGDLVHDTPIFPGGVRQEILQHLIVTIGNCFGHALHVAFFRLYQSTQVMLGCLDHTVVARLKSFRKRSGESLVVQTQLLGQFPIANPIF
jgi:hypothetical protein